MNSLGNLYPNEQFVFQAAQGLGKTLDSLRPEEVAKREAEYAAAVGTKEMMDGMRADPSKYTLPAPTPMFDASVSPMAAQQAGAALAGVGLGGSGVAAGMIAPAVPVAPPVAAAAMQPLSANGIAKTNLPLTEGEAMVETMKALDAQRKNAHSAFASMYQQLVKAGKINDALQLQQQYQLSDKDASAKLMDAYGKVGKELLKAWAAPTGDVAEGDGRSLDERRANNPALRAMASRMFGKDVAEIKVLPDGSMALVANEQVQTENGPQVQPKVYGLPSDKFHVNFLNQALKMRETRTEELDQASGLPLSKVKDVFGNETYDKNSTFDSALDIKNQRRGLADRLTEATIDYYNYRAEGGGRAGAPGKDLTESQKITYQSLLRAEQNAHTAVQKAETPEKQQEAQQALQRAIKNRFSYQKEIGIAGERPMWQEIGAVSPADFANKVMTASKTGDEFFQNMQLFKEKYEDDPAAAQYVTAMEQFYKNQWGEDSPSAVRKRGISANQAPNSGGLIVGDTAQGQGRINWHALGIGQRFDPSGLQN